MSKTKIKVGVVVTVVDPGYVYSTHQDLFRELGFFNTDENQYNEEIKRPWIVCGRSEEKHDGRWVFKIQDVFDETNQLLISKKGLLRVGGWELN